MAAFRFTAISPPEGFPFSKSHTAPRPPSGAGLKVVRKPDTLLMPRRIHVQIESIESIDKI